MNPQHCPSSTPDAAHSEVFGIVEGTAIAPEVTYLEHPFPVTQDLLAMAAPVEPTEVFRFVGVCAKHRCQQFGKGHCQLAKRIVAGLPAVIQNLPNCAIRQRCRWWYQEGSAACLRCPQIVRTNHDLSDTLRNATALPPAHP